MHCCKMFLTEHDIKIQANIIHIFVADLSCVLKSVIKLSITTDNELRFTAGEVTSTQYTLKINPLFYVTREIMAFAVCVSFGEVILL